MTPQAQLPISQIASDNEAIDKLLASIENEGADNNVSAGSSVTGDEVVETLTTPVGVEEVGDVTEADAPKKGKKAATKKDPAAPKKGKKEPAKKTAAPTEDTNKTEAQDDPGEAGGVDLDAMVEAGMEQNAEAAKPTKPKKTAAEKEPAKRRVTYVGNRRSVVLADRAGDRLAKLMILEHADEQLSDDELKIKRDEFMRELDTKVAKKVAEKCVMLMKDLAVGTNIKNEVMRTAFHVLKRDGKLTSGDQGNLQQALISKYSIGTARSQANQMFTLFPLLKITVKEKGLMKPNPESTILAMINGPVEASE